MSTSTPTLTTALNRAISRTAANAAQTESTVTLRSSQAVAAKAIGRMDASMMALWSFMADWKMRALMLAGKLK